MREKILQVKTFGSFSMIYDGKSLFGRKVGETQFASMMQMLIHERKKGVSRDRLEQELFGEREVENVHHALQSVIYNAKKRLEKAGLPDVNYIEIRNGVVYWNDEIKVQEDATEFDQRHTMWPSSSVSAIYSHPHSASQYCPADRRQRQHRSNIPLRWNGWLFHLFSFSNRGLLYKSK